MLRDITIGQYYPSGSYIHKLDPRVKLAATVLFLVSLFPFDTITVYIISTVYLVSLIMLSKVPVKYIVKGLKPVVVLIILTGCMNLIFTRGENVLFTFWKISITAEGIRKAVFMVVRLIYLVIGSSLMTYTTTPNELTEGIEKALRPLNKIKVPVHEFALMMSLALRFIPILIEEADKIIKAQSSRGADFNEGKFIDRAKNMVSILIPLLVSAIQRANDLAMAMDARCYHGGDGRTKLRPLQYKMWDYLAYFVVILEFVLTITIGLLGL